MIPWWAWLIIGFGGLVACAIVYACCAVSSRISRDEERRAMLAEALRDAPAIYPLEDDQQAEDEMNYQRNAGEGLGLV